MKEPIPVLGLSVADGGGVHMACCPYASAHRSPMGADLTLPGYLSCHIQTVLAPPLEAVCNVLGPRKGFHPAMLGGVTLLSGYLIHLSSPS